MIAWLYAFESIGGTVANACRMDDSVANKMLTFVGKKRRSVSSRQQCLWFISSFVYYRGVCYNSFFPTVIPKIHKIIHSGTSISVQTNTSKTMSASLL